VNDQIVDRPIRTAEFLENLMCIENYICTLFENKADSNLEKIFSVRGNTMSLQKKTCECQRQTSVMFKVFSKSLV